MKSANIVEPFGLHLTLDAYGGNREKLADHNFIKKTLDDLPPILGMHKITRPKVLYYDGGEVPEDCGVSGFIMIAESHISIHTFSAKNFLTADVYSCKVFDTKKTLEFFKKRFDLRDMEVNIVKRGLKFPRSKPTFDQRLAPSHAII